MTPMTPPPAANPAGQENRAITSAELQEWLARRRKTRRKLMIVALALIAVAVSTATIYFATFGRQLATMSYLRSHGFMIDWDLNWSNARTGGVTTVAFAPETWSVHDPSPNVLERVRSLNHVKTLDVSKMVRLQDDDLEVVASLVELDDLELNRDGAGGDMLARSAGPGMPGGAAVLALTDRVLDHVQGLTRLQILGLAGNRITDAGLPKLANLQSLEMLDLDGTSVTNAGLDTLVGLKSLKRLLVQNTRVTKRGVARFQIKRPDVEVVHELQYNDEGTPLP